MTRRYQRLSRARARTFWLVWLAWAMFGSIFVMEDERGGTGWLTIILTSPFWIAFVLWPFLWAWTRFTRNPTWVEMDEDIPAGEVTARLVQKDGVRYADAAQILSVFGVKGPWPLTHIAGGDEAFVRIEDLRPAAKSNKALAAWLEVVDSLALAR